MKTLQTPIQDEVVARAKETATAINSDRRLWLTATTVFGGTGLVASAVPFVASLAPSEKARAMGGPVELELQGIQLGEISTVEWRGKPVFVLRRSRDMLDSLARHDNLLADPTSRRSIQPESTRNAVRSLKPEIAVFEAVCTHLGCIPSFRPTPGAPDIGASWPGVFTALAMVRSSTSPGGSSRTYPRRPTSRYRRTSLLPIQSC